MTDNLSVRARFFILARTLLFNRRAADILKTENVENGAQRKVTLLIRI